MTTATRLDLLVRQLDTSYEALRERCEGMTDDEYLWEPVPGCVTVRRHGDRWTFDAGGHDADPPPFVTIAGRLAHLTNGCLLSRWDSTFGSHSMREHREFFGTAAEGLAAFDDAFRKWRDGLGTLTDDQLDVVGLSQLPDGLDPDLPFGDILWWNNRELIHHGAEIAMLRDLWVHSHQPAGRVNHRESVDG
jgi:hypothetical protein